MQEELYGLQDAHTWARAYAASDPSASMAALFGGRSSPEKMPALVIPQLLSAEEVAECHAAANELGGDSVPCGKRQSALDGRSYDVAYSDEHIATYLHKNSCFQDYWPTLSSKLVTAMRSQPGDWGNPKLELRVRCIELHRC